MFVAGSLNADKKKKHPKCCVRGPEHRIRAEQKLKLCGLQITVNVSSPVLVTFTMDQYLMICFMIFFFTCSFKKTYPKKNIQVMQSYAAWICQPSTLGRDL